jgi:hypothetical protein
MLKSCLAGTTVQEVFETHPVLRDAANACFASGGARFKAMLDAACKRGDGRGRRKLDTVSLAALWMAAMQGSLILYKASQDDAVITDSLRHVREYIRALLTGSALR